MTTTNNSVNQNNPQVKQQSFNFFDADTKFCIGQNVTHVNAGWTGHITKIERANGAIVITAFDGFVQFSRKANARSLAVQS